MIAVADTPVKYDHPPLRAEYTRYYARVAHKFGARAPGRNIVRHGVNTRKGVRVATHHEVGRSVRTFKRWLAPPLAPVLPGDHTGPAPLRAGGAYVVPTYIVMRESGGSYTAYNATGCVGGGYVGCIGAYQLARMHFERGGICAGLAMWPPASQDECASRVLRVQGLGAWSTA